MNLLSTVSQENLWWPLHKYIIYFLGTDFVTVAKKMDFLILQMDESFVSKIIIITTETDCVFMLKKYIPYCTCNRTSSYNLDQPGLHIWDMFCRTPRKRDEQYSFNNAHWTRELLVPLQLYHFVMTQPCIEPATCRTWSGHSNTGVSRPTI